MAKRNARTTTATVVAEICLYGTTDARVGAGYLGAIGGRLTGSLFGSGEPKPGRTFTETVWMAVGELAARGITSGTVRLFDSGGERMTDLDLGAAIPIYGSMSWMPATVFTVTL